MTGEKGRKSSRQGITEDVVQFNFDVPIPLKSRLEEVSRRQGQTLSALARMAIQWYADHMDGDLAELEALRRIMTTGKPHLQAILRDVIALDKAYVWLDIPEAGRRIAVPKTDE